MGFYRQSYLIYLGLEGNKQATFIRRLFIQSDQWACPKMVREDQRLKSAAQQRQDALRHLVGLSQHGAARLRQDLRA